MASKGFSQVWHERGAFKETSNASSNAGMSPVKNIPASSSSPATKSNDKELSMDFEEITVILIFISCYYN